MLDVLCVLSEYIQTYANNKYIQDCIAQALKGRHGRNAAFPSPVSRQSLRKGWTIK